MRTCRPEYLVQVGGIVFPQLQVRSHHKYDKEAPDKRGCIETFPRDNLLFQQAMVTTSLIVILCLKTEFDVFLDHEWRGRQFF